MMVFECGDLSLTSKEGQLNVCQVYFIFFLIQKKFPNLVAYPGLSRLNSMGKWNMKTKATSQRCEHRTAAVSSFKVT